MVQRVDNYAIELFRKGQSVAEAEQESHGVALWRLPFVVVANDQRMRIAMGKTFTNSYINQDTSSATSASHIIQHFENFSQVYLS